MRHGVRSFLAIVAGLIVSGIALGGSPPRLAKAETSPSAPVIVGAPSRAASVKTVSLTPELSAKSSGSRLVPRNFGRVNGPGISNLHTFRTEIARAVSPHDPSLPAVEVFYGLPSAVGHRPSNRWGHVMMAYTRPDGTQRLIDIPGVEGHDVVSVLSPEEGLYGTSGPDAYYDRRGVYNRHMIGVQIRHLTSEQLGELDRYFTELKDRSDRGELRFALNPRRANLMNSLHRNGDTEYGNCTYWPSEALARIGLVRRPTMLPKNLVTQLIERQAKQAPENLTVVHYKRVTNAYNADEVVDGPGRVSPIHPIKDLKYGDLAKIADFVVAVPEDSTAVVAIPIATRKGR
jgi:hypothetical protein